MPKKTRAARKPAQLPQAGPKLLRIFISHKSKDRAVVMDLKQMLADRCRNLEVFASCDAEDLRGGDLWCNKIRLMYR